MSKLYKELCRAGCNGNDGDDMNRRVLLILLDSAGTGEAPDADRYGDCGSNTIGNTAKAVGGLRMPHLAALGLGRIGDFMGVEKVPQPTACFGKMQEVSCGKDTTCGHWEIAGTPVLQPLPTYPHGFPPEVILPFEQAIGKPVLANCVASGTEIIARLGGEHMRTGQPIVYTSADSVFQIACHEEIVPLPDLYEMCHIARKILVGEHGVGRVIARPFIGVPGNFTRTSNRRDFSLLPPEGHLLQRVKEAGLPCVSVGKIHDIFAESGITASYPTVNNQDGMAKTKEALGLYREGLIWTNLVDFDMMYGHRNDPQGYAKALDAFDQGLPEIMAMLGENDLLLITADHGNDPTTPSTDHSREYVPLLVWGKQLRQGVDLGIRPTFADAGATIADYLGVGPLPTGQSFLPQILK